MNFDESASDRQYYNMAQTQNSEAPANQWPAQDGDAIRLSNRLALQQQRFVKKSQVNTGLPSNNPATR